MTNYQSTIRTLISDESVDPRHVEAFMRVEYGTLDGIESFATAVNQAYIYTLTAYMTPGAKQKIERLAATYGL